MTLRSAGAVLSALALGAAGLAGCVGDIGGDESEAAEPGPEALCLAAEPDTEPTVVRMLNRREYANTVRDLLGVPIDVVADFPPDAIVGFDNQAESLVASSTLVEMQLDAAEAFAEAVDLDELVACEQPEDCVDELIVTLGRRAYRRPLTEDEQLALRELYDETQASGRTVDRSLRLVIEAMLMSPQFLYRAETTLGEDGVTQADPYEIASRLSYFLWASMPDDELLDAAEAGALVTPGEIEAQARRLLADPKAREVTAAFHGLWLRLYALPSVTKDPDAYPGYADLQPLFEEETRSFAEHVFWSSEGGASDYLLLESAPTSDELAAHYGDSERFGILTQGSFLSTFSNPDRTSPTRRGAFVRAQLLCQPPPPPPDDVPPLPPTEESEGTTRERLAEHVSNPACSGCHALIDPVGFGLEHYDTIGGYRTEDAGVAVDASGELIAVETGGGAFVGARELAEHLAATEEFYDCVATQWFRFAVGRPPGQRDACTLEEIETKFRESGDRLPELIVAIATSNAVLLKNTEAE